jgi:hypothetical protein
MGHRMLVSCITQCPAGLSMGMSPTCPLNLDGVCLGGQQIALGPSHPRFSVSDLAVLLLADDRPKLLDSPPFTSLFPSHWGLAFCMRMCSTAHNFISQVSSCLVSLEWTSGGPWYHLWSAGCLQCCPASCWHCLCATLVVALRCLPCVGQHCTCTGAAFGSRRW